MKEAATAIKQQPVDVIGGVVVSDHDKSDKAKNDQL